MKQKRKPKNSNGTVVIEFNHSGIPDDELMPEEFDEQQLAVLAALPPERQEQIRKGCPVAVIDMGSGATLATFNRKNIVLTEYQKKELARSVYEAAQRFYSDPENVKKYEAWKKERDARDKQK